MNIDKIKTFQKILNNNIKIYKKNKIITYIDNIYIFNYFIT